MSTSLKDVKPHEGGIRENVTFPDLHTKHSRKNQGVHVHARKRKEVLHILIFNTNGSDICPSHIYAILLRLPIRYIYITKVITQKEGKK